MKALCTAAVVVAVVVAGAFATTASTAGVVPWRPARAADAVAHPSLHFETWEFRAISPDGRRGYTIRFWTQGNPFYIEWIDERVGKIATHFSARVDPAAHAGPGVAMKEPFGHGSIGLVAGRWVLDAHGNFNAVVEHAHLTLRSARAGVTVGPLRVSNRAGWISVLAVGRADGFVELPTGRTDIRGWRAAFVHEWAEWAPGDPQTWWRRDLALVWRGATVRLVWGLEPPKAPWRGVVATIAPRRSVCSARGKYGAPIQDPKAYRMPASSLDVSCGGTTLRLRYAPKAIPYMWWIFRIDLQNVLARSSGAGFFEETVAPFPGP